MDCNARMDFGELQCPNCFSYHSVDFWDAIEHIENLSSADTDDLSEMLNDTLVEAEGQMLCCDRDYEDCECAVSVDATVCYDIPASMVYVPITECQLCIWYSTPACPALRELAIEFVVNDRTLSFQYDKIYPCEDWHVNPEKLETQY